MSLGKLRSNACSQEQDTGIPFPWCVSREERPRSPEGSPLAGREQGVETGELLMDVEIREHVRLIFMILTLAMEIAILHMVETGMVMLAA